MARYSSIEQVQTLLAVHPSNRGNHLPRLGLPMRSISSVAILLLLAALPATAQQTTKSQNDPRPVAQAALRKGDIVVDGRIDEAAWAVAKPVTELTQQAPDEGRPASQKTEIRILYDESSLYVAARMFDSLGAKG